MLRKEYFDPLTTSKKLLTSEGIEEDSKDSGINLIDCLNEFEKPELLDEDNKWYCSKCEVHVQAKKQMQIYQVPPVLVINLKRFKAGKSKFSIQSSWSSGGNGKLQTLVDFPVKGLDLTEYILH